MASGVQKRRYKVVLNEARQLGLTVEHAELGEGEGTGAVGAAVKAMLRRGSSATSMNTFVLARGDLRFAVIEPFDGAIMHPGELHAIVPGGLAQPLARVASGLRGGWACNDDAALTAQLDAASALIAAVKKLKWAKGTGATIHLGWALQVHGLGDGTSHVVMQAGDFAGLFAAKAGLGPFLAIVDALAPLMRGGASARQGLYHECRHELAFALLGGRDAARDPAA